LACNDKNESKRIDSIYEIVYTGFEVVIIMETAKIFNSGNSQAVRLPKEYRFSGTEVGIKKIGNLAILFPVDQAWETFLDGLNSFTDDFMSDGRPLQLEQFRDSL
jgi:antitoxin VapB